MKFCGICDNMFYLHIDADQPNILKMKCRYCENEEDVVDSTIFVNTYFNRQEKSIANFVNKYTKYDPTLPRVNHILCPNEHCLTNHHLKEHEHDNENKEEEQENEENNSTTKEIIYIRYDHDNLKYLYLCSTCDTCWKAN
jgi:DNA-directed RNA polymerase subunit M/transcription elongation factor TFIIS